jgi:hypothetical protein
MQKKLKYMFMSRHQTTGQNYYTIKIANKSFENAAKLKYLGTNMTDQNCIHSEIKNRLNSGIAWHHTVPVSITWRLKSKKTTI